MAGGGADHRRVVGAELGGHELEPDAALGAELGGPLAQHGVRGDAAPERDRAPPSALDRPAQLRDELADVDGNMTREVMEETGLDISGLPRGAGYQALSTQGGTVIFRRYHLPFDADEAAERIRAFVARQDEPEIEGPVIIRDARDLPDGLKPHMKPMIDWHFGV